MGQVVIDISTSVDGYVAGSGVTVERPFGDAGHRLHQWLGMEGVQPDAADRAAAEAMFANAGAFLLGRRMFDVGIGTWGDDGAFGLPTFVVTKRSRPNLVKGPTTFTFVTDGFAAALRQARVAAGEQDVV
ncbi:MAG: dihydrofolate reductase, partial [Actinomycetota bacterium]|nr:dihydrofolate reductase [Actinomycetota bacterium]